MPRFFLPFFLLVGLLASPAAAELRPTLACSEISDLAQVFLQKHIRYHTLTDEIRRRTADNFLESLDPQRVLFLQADADRIRADLQHAFAETRSGNCDRLVSLQQEAVERNRAAEAFVRKLMADPKYAVDPNAQLVLDPEKRGYPATPAQRDATQRALVHFQISNYLSEDTPLAEAKTRLVHRYELRTRRVAEITRDDLYAAFLDSFARALDPHSNFLSSEVMQDFNIQMKLSLEGIGVALSEEDGFAVVQQVIPGGPADRLKALEPNDRVIAVAEEGKQPVDVIDMALRDIVRLIRGRAGSKVLLTVLRQAEKTERFQVAIVRDKIDLEEQAAKLEVHEVPAGGRMLKLGVLDLPSFYGDGDPDPRKRQASRDVRRLLEDAKRQHVDGLVLDLSRNGGGLLDDAVKLSGYFIRAGGIVGVREANERSRIHHDPDAGIVYGGPLVVLTSRVSASASEILVGALQDYRRAVVVGDDHTFGKGTVQSLIALPPGDPAPKGGIKITTGMFFRPGGDSTQHAGVAADVRLPSLLATDEIGESAQPNALPVERVAPFASRVANDASNGWRPLTPELLAELARRSHERVGKDKYFVEIEKKLAERAADGGVTKLAEILAEQAEAKKNDIADARPTAGAGDASLTPPPGAPTTAKKEDEAPNPHLDEALRVLADLVQLSA